MNTKLTELLRNKQTNKKNGTFIQFQQELYVESPTRAEISLELGLVDRVSFSVDVHVVYVWVVPERLVTSLPLFEARRMAASKCDEIPMVQLRLMRLGTDRLEPECSFRFCGKPSIWKVNGSMKKYPRKRCHD